MGRAWPTPSRALPIRRAAKGHQITAGENYMRAGNYYYAAERIIVQAGRRGRGLGYYKKAIRCYHAAIKRLHPNVEHVEVPYQGGAMRAFFMKAQATLRARRPSWCSTAWTTARK